MGGQKGASHKRVELVMKLPQLQNLIKRDPVGYKEEFLQQYRNYMSELEIFRLKPGKESDRFAELVTFISHVAPCYKDECKDLPKQLMSLLEEHGAILSPTIRVKLVQALVLLRNRGMLNPTDLLQLFFRLFRVQDKTLRQLLFEHTVSDIRNVNQKARNEKMNKTLQGFMYTMLQDESEIAAKKSLDVMIELYKKRVWIDARTVNVIATALNSTVTKLVTTALNFFLNIDTIMDDDDDDLNTDSSKIGDINYHEHAKKTAATARKVKKQIKERAKKINAVVEDKAGLFPAINLLNDPQGVAEKVFKRLRSSNERFEVKLLMMNFISRVIGGHQLIMLPFYSFLQRYIQSHQREVTHILAYLVQACHTLVPPDDILPVIKAISFNFITERCTGDVMAVGINVIKEVIKRIPSVLDEDGMDAFCQDICAYTRNRDKSVVVAARGFTNLIRDIYPSLLRSRDRGKFHDILNKPLHYGDLNVLEGVDGAELLTLVNAGIITMNSDSDNSENESENSDENDSENEDNSDENEELDNQDDDQEASDNEANNEINNESNDESDEGVDEEVDEDNDSNDDGSDNDSIDDDDNESVDEELDEADETDDILTSKTTSSSTSKIMFADDVKIHDGGNEVKLSMKSTKTIKSVKSKNADNDMEVDLRNIQVIQSKRVDANKILTAEDFETIRKLKARLAEQRLDPRNRRKRKHSSNANDDNMSDDDYNDTNDDIAPYNVDASDLEGYKKRRRLTLEERLESVLQGREKFSQSSHAGGLTNLEKERKKNFLMVRKSRQLREKQSAKPRRPNSKNKRAGHEKKAQLKRDKRKKRRT